MDTSRNIPAYSSYMSDSDTDNLDSGVPTGHHTPNAQAGPTRYGVDEPSGIGQQSPLEQPHDADWESRDRVVYASGRVAPLDYLSDTPRPPVFLCEAFTAPAYMQKHAYPDPAIANVQKPSHTPSMPYSHMGIYQSAEMLGKDEDVSPPPKGNRDEGPELERPRGLMMHAPTAPPPYPKPTDLHSWVLANQDAGSPGHNGPVSAPIDSRSTETYPTSMVSLDRPFNWIEDVKADQAIEADGFKRCSRCSISYRITDGKRCRCTPSEGDGERPV